ncbi:hypothetical protein [Mucilaginibacter psychrotolerans]|uniref:Transcriptional regulator n=1 Tax=Mucilaginibacter psychrotolerans TaxID=1524096 RepID=A0A4Y8SGI3_9SPHI|nr:hypothetical protein [Mucilaginibacter psychrotolerans]TFF37740.1 hypothetical protein E2R66_11270 [Mucilaginibacter psychrotolerans]
MAKSTIIYDPDDVALAAFNKIMASPDCVLILNYLRTQDDWTGLSQLGQIPLETKMIKECLKSLEATNVVSTVNQDGISFYRLNLAYFERLSIQFKALVYQMSERQSSTNL